MRGVPPVALRKVRAPATSPAEPPSRAAHSASGARAPIAFLAESSPFPLEVSRIP